MTHNFVSDDDQNKLDKNCVEPAFIRDVASYASYEWIAQASTIIPYLPLGI